LTLTLKIYFLQENGFKENPFIKFTTILVIPSSGAPQSHERDPKNVQMTLKDQSFVNKVKVSFVCNPEDV
jgi:hypothetical protein